MKKLKKVTVMIAVVLFAWFAVSFFDTVAHNISPDPQYLPFNLFTLIF